MKKQFIIGAIISFISAIVIAKYQQLTVLKCFIAVPLSAVIGGVVWTFFAWLAEVCPFLDSFSSNSSWFMNFLWTYLLKPLLYSVLVAYLVVSVCAS
ncbi:MAG: hypothetical protein IKK38_09895 [Spirochaetaceae bacterium]|nr:hypothetical protein [Spirochaetaceae bacterium]